jgi:prepilin-type N-terminal cleavage/methylation domain-containing protein
LVISGHSSVVRAASSRSAFTLIEVLVAVVILAIGITVILQTFSSSTRAMGQCRDSIRADAIIAEQVAELRERIRKKEAPGRFFASGRIGYLDGNFLWERRIRERDRVEVMTPGQQTPRKARLLELEIAAWREGSTAKYTGATLVHVMEEEGTSNQ